MNVREWSVVRSVLRRWGTVRRRGGGAPHRETNLFSRPPSIIAGAVVSSIVYRSVQPSALVSRRKRTAHVLCCGTWPRTWIMCISHLLHSVQFINDRRGRPLLVTFLPRLRTTAGRWQHPKIVALVGITTYKPGSI